MYSADSFEYTERRTDSESSVVVDDSIREKERLLERLAVGLKFPDYFGGNWDALIDCLSDMSWFEGREAVIDHQSLPALPQPDLRLYLESLIDAGARRTTETAPRLRFLFRERDRAAIQNALAGHLT
jgi:hypothetical protein